MTDFSISGFVFFLLMATTWTYATTLALETQCEKNLETADKQLVSANAKGFGGTVAYVKAAGLLMGGAVQQQFGKYQNCVVKVKRARKLINKAEQGKPS